METKMVHTLTATFEAHAQQTENGVEFWLARDLQHLLGYAEWRNFTTVISKAKTACEVSGHSIGDHFVGVNKMVEIGSESRREIDDIMLTRYACATSPPRTAIQERRRSLLLKPTLPCRPVVRNLLSSVYWKQNAFLHVKNFYYVLWYAKNIEKIKARKIFTERKQDELPGFAKKSLGIEDNKSSCRPFIMCAKVMKK